MSLFPSINAVYSTYFGTSPPTRACVAVILPGTARIKLEGIAQKEGRRGRKALHVQSLSYWAAANIGPYSQAVTVRPCGTLSFFTTRILIAKSKTMQTGRRTSLCRWTNPFNSFDLDAERAEIIHI